MTNARSHSLPTMLALALAAALSVTSASAQVSSILDIQRTGGADGSAVATWNSASGTVNAVGAAWDTAPVFPGGAGTFNSAQINPSASVGNGGEILLILDGGFDPSLNTLSITEGANNGDLRIASSAAGTSTILMQNEGIVQYTGGNRAIDIDTSVDFGAANVGADTIRILNNTDGQQLTFGGDSANNGATAGNSLTQGAGDTLQLGGRGVVAFDHSILDGPAVFNGTVESNLGREQTNVLPWTGTETLRFRAEATENDAEIEIQNLIINTPSSTPAGWVSDLPINNQVDGSQAAIRIERVGNGVAQLDIGTYNQNTDLLNLRGLEGGRNSRMVVRDTLNFDADGNGTATLRFFNVPEFGTFAPLNQNNLTLNITGNGSFRPQSATASTGSGTINLTNGATIFQNSVGGLGSNHTVDVGRGSAFRINPNMVGNAASISSTIVRDGGYFSLQNNSAPLTAADFGTVGSGTRIQIAPGAIIDERTLLNNGGVGTTELPSLAGQLFLGLQGTNTTEVIDGLGSDTNQLFRGIGIGNGGGNNLRGTYQAGGSFNSLDFRITGMPNNGESTIFRGLQNATGVVATDEPIFDVIGAAASTVNFEVTRESNLQFRTVSNSLTASGGTRSTQGLGGNWDVMNINGSDTDNNGVVDIEYTHETVAIFRRSPRVAPGANPELLDYSGGTLVTSGQIVNINAGIRLADANVNQAVSTANAIRGTVNINENAVLWLTQNDNDLDSYSSGIFNINEGGILRINNASRLGGGATYNSSPGARLLADADLNFTTLMAKNAGTNITDFTIDLSAATDDDFTGINLGNGQGINGSAARNNDINTANVGTGLNVITSSAASVNLRSAILHTETNDLPSGNPFIRQLRIDGNLEMPNTDVHINVEGAGPVATGIPTAGYVFISGADRTDLKYTDAAGFVFLNGLSTAQNMVVHNGNLRVGNNAGEGPGGANAELTLSGDLTLHGDGIGPNNQHEFLSGNVNVAGVIDINPSGNIGTRYVGGITTTNNELGRLVIDANDGAVDQGLIDGLANDTMAQGTDGIRLNNRSSIQILYTAAGGAGSPGTLFDINQTFTSNMQNGQFNSADNGLIQINETSTTLGTVNFNDIQVNDGRSFRINENGGAVARANITARGDIEMSVNGNGDDFDILGLQSDMGGTARTVQVSGSTFGAAESFDTSLLGVVTPDIAINLVNLAVFTVDVPNGGVFNGSATVQGGIAGNSFVSDGGTTTIIGGERLLVLGQGTVAALNGGEIAISGTLAGNGTVTADTTILTDGAVEPGNNNIATLMMTGNVTVNDNNIYRLGIANDPGIGPGTPGTDYDTVAGINRFLYPTGDDNAEVMTIQLEGNTSFDPTGAIFDLYQYTTLGIAGGTVGSVANGGLVITGAPAGWVLTDAFIAVDDDSLFLAGIIPEPSQVLLTLLGLSALLLRRSRSR
ncbi:MAG: PEP-CTERM sorting domain-containing protein [Verrucomicrobiota bacterium]